MAEEKTYDIPKECWAGVVKNEGPDFEVEVPMPLSFHLTSPSNIFPSPSRISLKRLNFNPPLLRSRKSPSPKSAPPTS